MDKEQLRVNSMKLVIDLTNKMIEKGYTTPEKIAENIDLHCFLTSPSMLHIDSSASVRNQVHCGLYCKTIKNLGSEKHMKYLEEGTQFKRLGCYGLTELGHGSNVKGIETTATYVIETREFVINSPTRTSMKFWIGNLAWFANMGIMWAQLIIKGKNYGIHAFIM